MTGLQDKSVKWLACFVKGNCVAKSYPCACASDFCLDVLFCEGVLWRDARDPSTTVGMTMVWLG